jgi:hypothetical protein
VTEPLPKISAIVLAWLAEPMLQRSVESLLGSEKVDVEVILVDKRVHDRRRRGPVQAARRRGGGRRHEPRLRRRLQSRRRVIGR